MLDFYHQNILKETLRKMLTVVLYGKIKEIQLDVDCNIIHEILDQTVNDFLYMLYFYAYGQSYSWFFVKQQYLEGT